MVLPRYLSQESYFNPLPPHGGRQDWYCPVAGDRVFQSTPSAWRETIAVLASQRDNTFQSTPSAWRETIVPRLFPLYHSEFQSTPSAWRETVQGEHRERWHIISIHSLRMEGDPYAPRLRVCAGLFQSTPSAWRETTLTIMYFVSKMEFQSTPSAWRETYGGTGKIALYLYFNPLPPHGGRQVIFQAVRRYG